MPADPAPDTRRAPSIRRRLLAFAVLILTPVVIGALVSGGVLLRSASQSDRLGAEIVQESRASIALLRDLHAARVAGSGYMEEGESDELADFDRAAVAVAVGLRSPSAFDEPRARAALRGAQREWRAAVDQLRHTQAGFGQGPAGEADPEDVFEAHVTAALAGVQRLVAHGQDEADAELVAARRAARWQALAALVALLVALATAVALASRMAAALPRPLEQLTRAVRAMGAGDLDQHIPEAPSAELRELGETFNRMAAALREQHEQLERQAFTDPLTGVPNRALFERRARAALERGRGTVGVLMIDLDDFKLINDGLGHLSGDQLIRLAAERISAAARPSDTVARLGGDEFAVLLEDLRGLDDALAAAERLRRRFDAPFDLDGSQVVVSASIGVALAQGSLDPVELLRRADLAMYRVKERGKDGTMFFDPQMEDRAVGRLDAVNALRAALDRGELVAHFQPIVELASGDVVSAEALLRWERPGHGLVPPLDFIPLAEETGLIQPIGAWILEEACTQARLWRADGHERVRVSVNVSARQLLDPEFERMVEQTLRKTGLEPDALVLEVTESSVMQNAELTIPKLERIVGTGVRLSLDDFGEGYSSLSHIRRLPITGLKIARPFVRELGDRGGDPRLVHGIIELARRLDLTLVAEGIELRAQEEALRSFGCRFGQGFLFSRPVPAPAFRALLAGAVTDPVT